MKPAQAAFAQAAAEAGRLFAAGQLDAAAQAYRQLLAQAPGVAELHFNHASVLRAMNDAPGALAAFERAARHKPGWTLPLIQQGILHFLLGQTEAAEQVFARVVALEPDNLAARFNLARSLIANRAWRLAIPHLQAARRLAPDNEEIWLSLRDTLRLTGRHQEAVEDFLAFEKTGKPSKWTMLANLASCRSLGDPAREAKAVAEALAWPFGPGDGGIVAEALMLLHYFDVRREDLFRLYQTYDRLQLRPERALANPQRRAGKRWRIGYVSADFRRHVMGSLIAKILQEHDRERFEIYCYSLAPAANEDDLTDLVRGVSQRFLRLEDLSDEAAASAIAQDDLDVLVDLMAHTSFARPGIYLHRPARLMITHLGYHGALGLREIDFKLSDHQVDLPENERYLIEKLLPMGACVLPFRRVEAAAQPPASRAGLGLGEATIVFGTFVSALKMSPRCLEVWRRILAALPEAVLAFSPHAEADRPALLRQAQGHGIAPERIVFIPPGANEGEARARYRLVDVVLDTFPYSGGDTTTAALDMQVPVVALSGLRQGERMSLSILKHLGVTETIAQSEDDYVAIALRLAREPEWRAQLAQRIQQQLIASGLADTKRYTRALEAAYLEALQRKGNRSADRTAPE